MESPPKFRQDTHTILCFNISKNQDNPCMAETDPPVTLKLTPMTPKWIYILPDLRQVCVPSFKLIPLTLVELCPKTEFYLCDLCGLEI